MTLTKDETRVIPKWRGNPDRHCKDHPEFADLTLVHSPGKRHKIEAMQIACTSCPVYYDCLQDLLAYPMWEHYGIRAALRGKT